MRSVSIVVLLLFPPYFVQPWLKMTSAGKCMYMQFCYNAGTVISFDLMFSRDFHVVDCNFGGRSVFLGRKSLLPAS